MYVITGMTGKVGGAVTRELLASNVPVRGVVRDINRAQRWAALGCQLFPGHMEDVQALAAAFDNAEGVFILPPSEFDPAPGFPEARAVIETVAAAIRAARPKKVVCLSTIGAQASTDNLLTQRTLMEQALLDMPVPVAFLRPGWFMENAAWDVASAHDDGVMASFLQPLDKPVPMVATADVGRIAAALLQETWQGVRIVELEGPRRISPHELAQTFARVLGRPVRAEAVDRRSWETLFRSQGMKHPMPRMRMLDGFNEGWIDFEGPQNDIVRGRIDLQSVIETLVARHFPAGAFAYSN